MFVEGKKGENAVDQLQISTKHDHVDDELLRHDPCGQQATLVR